MIKFLLGISFCLICAQLYAEVVESNSSQLLILHPTTKTILSPSNKLISSQTSRSISTQAPDLSNINNLDNNADDLIQIKRKVEIEKAQAELRKLNNTQTPAEAIKENSLQTAQTTVTGVAINNNGKKIAWLQFADGGALTVNIGSHLGKYIVSDITMNGVQLSYKTGYRHPKIHNIYLKRSYSGDDSQANIARNSQSITYSPSPIITPANTNNVMVPPIISR